MIKIGFLQKENKLLIDIYIKDKNNITYYDKIPNPVQIIKNKTIIYIVNNLKNVCECIVDTEDLLKLNTGQSIRGHRRLEDYTTYCVISTAKGLSSIGIHRLIMDCPKDKIIDYADRNALNNTKTNLIITEHKQNMLNKRTPKNNIFGEKNIRIENGKYIVNFIRQFDTLEKAIKIRDIFITEVLKIEYPELIGKKNKVVKTAIL